MGSVLWEDANKAQYHPGLKKCTRVYLNKTNKKSKVKWEIILGKGAVVVVCVQAPGTVMCVNVESYPKRTLKTDI